jgi:putative SOS response-associated peptidase YedK
MCGRYALTSPVEALRKLFGVASRVNLAARYNIAPGTDIAVIRQAAGGRELAMLRWGFLPRWAKPGKLRPMINARAETAAEKPSFRAAFANRRCLVPADGFYEWQARGKGAKQPYFIYPASGPVAFAGIWERWQGPDGEALDTVAILTTAANKRLQPIHHRVPAVIVQDAYATWLETEDITQAQALLSPPADDFFHARPVSGAVNSVANDTPDIQNEQTIMQDQPETGDGKAAQPGLFDE